MRSKSKPPVAAIAAAALLCLVLISMHMTAGMFARYTVKAEGPEDSSARVAAYNASAEAPTEGPVTIIANGTDENGIATYALKLKNDSEAAVRYDAEVNFNNEDDRAKFDGDDGKLTFSGNLAPNEVTEETVTFDMSEYFKKNDKWNTFGNDDISGESGIVPFEVDVKFTQID